MGWNDGESRASRSFAIGNGFVRENGYMWRDIERVELIDGIYVNGEGGEVSRYTNEG